MGYPIVFIPGLFGSLGEDVIKGTGDFSFGAAEGVYRPFIRVLNSMGYEEGVDLFISYYDWKKSVLEAVNKYLYIDVEKVKKSTRKDKVILIGHSLGGLLGRAYISYFSPSSVDKLIMIGTPNLGSVNAYYFWSGGEVPYSKVEDNILYSGLKAGFMLYYRLFKKTSSLDALRNMFPVAKDLLPSFGYGNYLFYEKSGTISEIPIEEMTIQNTFLNSLEERHTHIERLYIISGTGIFTNKELLIDSRKGQSVRWSDGKPVKAYMTNQGDGTVTTHSTFGNLNGGKILIEGNHIDILYKSKEYLSCILGRSTVQANYDYMEWMPGY